MPTAEVVGLFAARGGRRHRHHGGRLLPALVGAAPLNRRSRLRNLSGCAEKPPGTAVSCGVRAATTLRGPRCNESANGNSYDCARETRPDPDSPTTHGASIKQAQAMRHPSSAVIVSPPSPAVGSHTRARRGGPLRAGRPPPARDRATVSPACAQSGLSSSHREGHDVHVASRPSEGEGQSGDPQPPGVRVSW
jgi:hypothetical protein